MNGKKYYEWSKHYDPEKLELQCLSAHGVKFENAKVLEVGCGTGRFTERILPISKEIFSIDPDSNALDVLKSNCKDIKLTVMLGTLESIQIKKNYFDYVVFPWSIYLIKDKEKNLKIAYDALIPRGKLVVLQANSGEYEEEIAQLYHHYDSLGAYQSAGTVLEKTIKNVFGNVIYDSLCAYFYFDTIEQLIKDSVFFIEDEEGMLPTPQAVEALIERIKGYI